MKSKRWLCYQMIIENHDNNTAEMQTIIRNIGAESKEEALGKFILNTSGVKAVKRLSPHCFLLDDLIKID